MGKRKKKQLVGYPLGPEDEHRRMYLMSDVLGWHNGEAQRIGLGATYLGLFTRSVLMFESTWCMFVVL